MQEDPVPLAFFVCGEFEVVSSLESCIKALEIETEKVLPVVYQPQAVFRVRAVARCTSTLQGHTEAVISTAFSPTGKWVTLSVKFLYLFARIWVNYFKWRAVNNKEVWRCCMYIIACC